jgi:hypothetical protein
MSSRGAVGVIAGIVFLVGVVIGYIPHSLPGDGVIGTITCGTPFSPDNASAAGTDLGSAAAGVTTDFAQQCSNALGTPRIISFVLIGVAVLVGLFALLTAGQAARTQPAPQRVSESS